MITFILGRGIEGCGVTKFTLEFNNWLNKNNIQSKIISISDKKWTRSKSHNVNDIIELKIKNTSDLEKLISISNDSDYVIISSLPSKSHTKECIDAFNEFLEKTTTRIVLFQHDHKSLSINRNECLMESIDKSEIIFSLSTENDFSRKVREFFPNKVIHTFQAGFPFDFIRKQFWKPIENQNDKHHKWIGRTTSWKGYKEMFQLHNQYLKPNKFLTTLEGIEQSIAFVDMKKLSTFRDETLTNPNNFDYNFSYGEDAIVFGPYNNYDLLERLSKCAFGYQLSHLAKKYITNGLEYTHCEVVAVGCIPVFNIEWGKACKHLTLNKPLVDCEKTGTIWLDKNNLEKTFEQINMLYNNKNLREIYRNDAFDFYKSHQDYEIIFPNIWNKILNYDN